MVVAGKPYNVVRFGQEGAKFLKWISQNVLKTSSEKALDLVLFHMTPIWLVAGQNMTYVLDSHITTATE